MAYLIIMVFDNTIFVNIWSILVTPTHVCFADQSRRRFFFVHALLKQNVFVIVCVFWSIFDQYWAIFIPTYLHCLYIVAEYVYIYIHMMCIYIYIYICQVANCHVVRPYQASRPLLPTWPWPRALPKPEATTGRGKARATSIVFDSRQYKFIHIYIYIYIFRFLVCTYMYICMKREAYT